MASDTNQPTRLRDLLPGATYLPAGSDPSFTAVRSRASAVEPGDLYVHLDEFDSSDAEVAIARGAEAVVAERLLPHPGAPQVLVDDSRDAHRALVAATESLEPLPDLQSIVVAGVSGTERTATLLAAIYASAGEAVGLLTSRCEDDGEHCLPVRAGARPKVGAWLNRCVLGGVTRAIAQVAPGTKPQGPASVVCLPSLRADGLDERGEPRWDSPAGHLNAVLRSIGKPAADATVIANADDPDCLRAATRLGGHLTTFGASEAADIRITPVESDPSGQTFLITHGAESACVAMPTPGRAARRDAAAAIATALALGSDLRTAVRGIDLGPSLPAHLETIAVGQAFTVRLDAAMRPNDLADALEGARGGGRLLATLGLADDSRVAAKQIATAARLADRVFAFGETELLDKAPPNVTLVEDRLTAVAVALGLADEGDAVLLAGCGDDASAAADRSAAEKLLRRRLACEDRDDRRHAA